METGVCTKRLKLVIMLVTDSPAGQYQPGQETVVRLIQDIDLSYIDNPIIQYKAKWDIEDGWDFVRFKLLIQDVGWVTTAGIYTESGSGQPAQAFGEQGYMVLNHLGSLRTLTWGNLIQI